MQCVSLSLITYPYISSLCLRDLVLRPNPAKVELQRFSNSYVIIRS